MQRFGERSRTLGPFPTAHLLADVRGAGHLQTLGNPALRSGGRPPQQRGQRQLARIAAGQSCQFVLAPRRGCASQSSRTPPPESGGRNGNEAAQTNGSIYCRACSRSPGSERTRAVPAAKCSRQGSNFGRDQLESELLRRALPGLDPPQVHGQPPCRGHGHPLARSLAALLPELLTAFRNRENVTFRSEFRCGPQMRQCRSAAARCQPCHRHWHRAHERATRTRQEPRESE